VLAIIHLIKHVVSLKLMRSLKITDLINSMYTFERV